MLKTLFVLLTSSLYLAAADASGKWAGTMVANGEDQSRPVFLILKQDGQKLTGTGGPNEGQQFPMEKGRVEGDRLVFEVPAGAGVHHFDLKLSGDQASGEMRYTRPESEARTAKVTLKRQS